MVEGLTTLLAQEKLESVVIARYQDFIPNVYLFRRLITKNPRLGEVVKIVPERPRAPDGEYEELMTLSDVLAKLQARKDARDTRMVEHE